jgi:DNA-binding response OmpR family regulator
MSKKRLSRVFEPSTRTETEKPPGPEKRVRASQDPPIAEAKRILIIDDDESVLEVTQRIVKRLGFRVLTAHDGQEAVDLARSFEGEIHLALLDMGMPVMGGVETYPLLRETRPKMKVIIYSGYKLDDRAQALLDAGASAFIQKPFHIGVLRAEIRRALEG